MVTHRDLERVANRDARYAVIRLATVFGQNLNQVQRVAALTTQRMAPRVRGGNAEYSKGSFLSTTLWTAPPVLPGDALPR
jgi:hypothetical protein